MGGLSIARGIVGGVAGAAGDTNTQQEMLQANQQAEQQKQNALKAKIAPLSLGITNLQKGIQTSYAQYQQAHPEWQGDFDQWKTGPGAQQFGQFTDATQQNVHAMREILHPDHQAGPTDWLKTHLTDRLHITNADHRAEDEANNQAWNKYDESQLTQKAGNITPADETPQAKQEKTKQAGALALDKQKSGEASTLEDKKLGGQFALESEKLKTQLELEDKKAANAQTIEDKKTAEQNKIELIKQQMFNQSQERIEREHSRGAGAIGTWAVQEDEQGNPVLFNSKTGEQKAAPAGMHKSGFYAKQVAPLDAASMNVDQYMKGGNFTGSGDLDLQHQFFVATQVAGRSNMTKHQQDLLAESQSVVGRLKAGWARATGGTIFSDKQRQEIAQETQNAIAAKKKALNIGPKTQQLQDSTGGPSDDDIIKALSGRK